MHGSLTIVIFRIHRVKLVTIIKLSKIKKTNRLNGSRDHQRKNMILQILIDTLIIYETKKLFDPARLTHFNRGSNYHIFDMLSNPQNLATS